MLCYSDIILIYNYFLSLTSIAESSQDVKLVDDDVQSRFLTEASGRLKSTRLTFQDLVEPDMIKHLSVQVYCSGKMFLAFCFLNL